MTGAAVAIAHAGDPDLLAPCLGALARAPGVAEISITMPATAGASRAVAEAHGAIVVLTETLEPFAVATNRAVASTSADHVLLLNDDTEVRPNAINELLRPLLDDPIVGATAPRLVNSDLTQQGSLWDDLTLRAAVEMVFLPVLSRWPGRLIARAPRRSFPTEPEPVDWAAAAALLIRRDLYERVEGLDERFPHGIEDAVLCREIRGLGYRVLAVPSAEVVHHGSPSGLRSRDAERVAGTLAKGVEGWELYFRIYRPSSARWIRPLFTVHALSRYLVLRASSVWREHDRVRLEAYRTHVIRLLSK